jgi:hypothetical protein
MFTDMPHVKYPAASITIPITVRAHLPWQAPRRLSTAAVAHESRERSDEEGLLKVSDSEETQENASRNPGEGQLSGDKHFTSFPKTRFSSVGSISRRHLKILRPSALNVLGIWLGIRDPASREDYWREMEPVVSSTTLPAALLYHLNVCSAPPFRVSISDHYRAKNCLSNRCLAYDPKGIPARIYLCGRGC